MKGSLQDDPVATFADFLLNRGLASDVFEAADLIWLLTQIADIDGLSGMSQAAAEKVKYAAHYDGANKLGAEVTGTLTSNRPLDVIPDISQSAPIADGRKSDASPQKDRLEPRSRTAGISTQSSEKTTDSIPFQVPGGDPLPGRRAMALALRPLGQRGPAHLRREVDIDRSVDDAARWMEATNRRRLVTPLHLRPVPERSFSASVVIDNSPSMAIWRATSEAFVAMVQESGLFQRVRAYDLTVGKSPSGDSRQNAMLRAYAGNAIGAPWGSSQGLEFTTSPHLIMVCTDTVGPGWLDGNYISTFREWAERAVIVIVHVLPRRMWTLTGLGQGQDVRLRATSGVAAFAVAVTSGRPLTHNSALEIAAPSSGTSPLTDITFSLPVVAPHVAHLQALAEVLVGGSVASITGVQLSNSGRAETEEPTRGQADQTGAVEEVPDPAEVVKSFLAWASPGARRLGAHLAYLSTFTIELIRLVQTVTARNADGELSDIAEVYLSGLLHRADGRAGGSPELNQPPDRIPLAMHPDVATLLRKTIPAFDGLQLITRISDEVARRLGQPNYFLAFLRGDLSARENLRDLEQWPIFAYVAAETLVRLGGQYTEFARTFISPTYQPRGIKFVSETAPHTSTINRFAWSADGEWLIAPSSDGSASIWSPDGIAKPGAGPTATANLSDGSLNQVWLSKLGSDAVFEKDGLIFVIPLTDLLTNQPTGKQELEQVTDGGALSVAWRGDVFSVVTADGNVATYFRRSRNAWTPTSDSSLEVYEFFGPIAAAAAAILPEDEGESSTVLVAFGFDDGRIEILPDFYSWYLSPPHFRREASVVSGRPICMSWSPRNRVLVTGTSEGHLFCWADSSHETASQTKTWSTEQGSVIALAFDPSGRLLAVERIDGSIELWRCPNKFDDWRIVSQIEGAGGSEKTRYSGLAWHPTLPWLVGTGGDDKSLQLWEVDFIELLAPILPIRRLKILLSASLASDSVRQAVKLGLVAYSDVEIVDFNSLISNSADLTLWSVVSECDGLLQIVGQQTTYGDVIPADYDAAMKEGLPCFVYLSRQDVTSSEMSTATAEFRARLERECRTHNFADPNDIVQDFLRQLRIAQARSILTVADVDVLEKLLLEVNLGDLSTAIATAGDANNLANAPRNVEQFLALWAMTAEHAAPESSMSKVIVYAKRIVEDAANESRRRLLLASLLMPFVSKSVGTGFYYEPGIRLLAARELEPDELIHGTINIFRTSTQRTWFVVTDRRIMCLLDSEGTRKRNRVIQWVMPIDRFGPMSIEDKTEKTGYLHVGRRKPWLVTKKLFEEWNGDPRPAINALLHPEASQTWQHSDLTVASGAPRAIGNPFGYVDSNKMQHILYRDIIGHINELWHYGSDWHHHDLTKDVQAVRAFGEPAEFIDLNGLQHVVYLAESGHLLECWYQNGDWSLNDLTLNEGAPLGTGHASAYRDGQGISHVSYQGNDGHIQQLCRTLSNWYHVDATRQAGAPPAAGSPSGYMFDAEDSQHVVYLGTDNHIHELAFAASNWQHNDLTDNTGSPLALGDPHGYAFEAQESQHVVYRGSDNHVHELYFVDGQWRHNDLAAATRAAEAIGDPHGYVFANEGTRHINYRSTDGHVNELWWDDRGWHYSDLTALTDCPLAAGEPRGYVDSENKQHVIYRGVDNHVHELWWGNQNSSKSNVTVPG